MKKGKDSGGESPPRRDESPIKRDESPLKRIEELLSAEKMLYREVLGLSREQNTALTPDVKVGSLEKLVAKKEERFGKIARMDREINDLAKKSPIPLGGGAGKRVSGPDGKALERIEGLAEEVRSLIQEILEEEKEGRRKIEELQGDLKRQITKMQTGRQVIDRYGSGRKIRSPIIISIKR